MIKGPPQPPPENDSFKTTQTAEAQQGKAKTPHLEFIVIATPRGVGTSVAWATLKVPTQLALHICGSMFMGTANHRLEMFFEGKK